MSTLTKDQIKTAAMELDTAEREALANELLLSIDDISQKSIDEAWLAEVHRREGLLASDPSRRKTLDQVIDSLRQRSQA